MHVSQSLVAMPSSFVHLCLAFTWKIMWDKAWVFRRIFSKWPHCRGRCRCKHMQSCSWDLSLFSRGSLQSGQIGCAVLPYTRPTRASVNPQGARTPPRSSLVKLIYSDVQRSVEPHSVMLHMNIIIIILCASSLIIFGEVSLCLWTYNMHEVPLNSILSSFLTQPSNLIFLLHQVTHFCWIFILISFSCSWGCVLCWSIDMMQYCTHHHITCLVWKTSTY